jgi:apoptotic chromatin condensation inducer in the nucleus
MLVLFLKDREDDKSETVAVQPGRLLDDLFRKTKATPCIYWMPLSEEQVG